jgi:ATP-dependent DNA helicase RecQ
LTGEWEVTRGIVLSRDGHRCVECGADLVRDGAHVHHVLPRASGGTDEPANLISLCQMCHAAVHPNLQARLARRLIEKVAVRLAEWLDREGKIARATRNFRPALHLFGLNGFRAGQVEVVEAALRGRSLLLVSPTGSGKSMAFQIPAVLTPGLCVVITPLKALMSDQVSGLLRRRIPATFVNSDITREEKQIRFGWLQRTGVKFVYLAPERFFVNNKDEIRLLGSLRPSYLVIDEAHCVDRWGRDFRPEYGRLAEVRRLLGNPPVLAFTATAGRVAQSRIVTSLGVPDADIFVYGVNRPNISFLRRAMDSDRRPAFIARLLRLAKRLGIKSMVFVPTRRIGEELVAALEGLDVPTPFFHGQLDTREKDSLLQRYGGRLEPKLDRIVCTNAFGMGIDISDIRLVVHWQHPASPEDYLQEFGRAGRNGERSVAVLLMDRRPDSHTVGLHDYMIDRTINGTPLSYAERIELSVWKKGFVRAMQKCAFEKSCFRNALLGYFGEARVAPKRSIAVRIIEWVFLQRQPQARFGICCDYCQSQKGKSTEHVSFICEALGRTAPRKIPKAINPRNAVN